MIVVWNSLDQVHKADTIRSKYGPVNGHRHFQRITLIHRFADVLFGKGVDHGVRIFAPSMSATPIILYNAFNPAARLIVHPGICKRLLTSVARELDAGH